MLRVRDSLGLNIDLQRPSFCIDVQKGLYKLPVTPFEAQIGKLWPSGVAQQG